MTDDPLAFCRGLLNALACEIVLATVVVLVVTAL